MTNVTVKTLSPKLAWQLMQDDPKALLVDVRSQMEFLFIGHPVGAIHIAWIDEPDWDINPHFAPEVRKLVLGGLDHKSGHNVPVLLICRSGKRSLEAGELLLKEGFHQSTTSPRALKASWMTTINAVPWRDGALTACPGSSVSSILTPYNY